MEENYDILIDTLERSVKKNGEMPLTNKHLLNILKMVRKEQEKDDYYYNFEPDING